MAKYGGVGGRYVGEWGSMGEWVGMWLSGEVWGRGEYVGEWGSMGGVGEYVGK